MNLARDQASELCFFPLVYLIKIKKLFRGLGPEPLFLPQYAKQIWYRKPYQYQTPKRRDEVDATGVERFSGSAAARREY